MKTRTLSRTVFTLLAMLFFLPAVLTSQQTKEQITVDWIYSGGLSDIYNLPQVHWLAGGKALLFDPSLPESLQTFEIFDPATGKRSPAVDRQKALASAVAVFGEEAAFESLPWPDAFDRNGEQGLYLIDGDVFIFDLRQARFIRITDTEEEEKSASFSPDGRRVAFVRGNDLYYYDLDEKREVRLTDDGSETLLNGTLSWVYWEEIFGRRDIGYWWSEDSKRIAFLQSDESGVDLMHYVDFQPALPRVLTQRYPKAGSSNPTVRIGVFDVHEKTIAWLDFPDAEYIVRVNWLPDNKRLAVQTMNRAQTRLDLFFVSIDGEQAEHILSETDTAWVNINDDLYFLKDKKQFIWQSERDGYAHLYLYKMDGTLVNQITRGEWAVRSAGGGVFWLRKAVVAVDEKRKWVYFTALKESSIEKHLYRIKFNGKKLQRLSTEAGTHSITFSPDGRYYFDRYSNISTPPALRLHQNDGTLVRTLGGPNLQALEKIDIRFPELMTIPARDGFAMPAQILKPADFDPAKKYPLIIYVYGGPSAPTVSNSFQFNNFYNQILLRQGFLVASVDNRSATAISKKLENRIVEQMYGNSELNDLKDAVRWFKKQSWIDPERVGIWGWSGGGTFTLLAMTRTQEFRAGIAVAGVTDWRYYDTKWAEAAMKRPQDNPEGYEATNINRFAKDLHGRLFIVHGTYDDNVHIQNTWAFVDALVAAGKQFDMMIYPMRKHGISDLPATIHLRKAMVAFWKRNLAPHMHE